MRRWTVPYESSVSSRMRYAVAAAGSPPALGLLYAFTGGGAQTYAGWAGMAAFTALWTTLVWRIAVVGVSVSDHGVRVRTVLRTRVVPWSAVERAWLGPATAHDAWAVWISIKRDKPPREAGTNDTEGVEKAETSEMETPIWRAGHPTRHRHRRTLGAADFTRLLTLINEKAASSTPRLSS